jgi:hypothetical protein
MQRNPVGIFGIHAGEDVNIRKLVCREVCAIAMGVAPSKQPTSTEICRSLADLIRESGKRAIGEETEEVILLGISLGSFYFLWLWCWEGPSFVGLIMSGRRFWAAQTTSQANSGI